MLLIDHPSVIAYVAMGISFAVSLAFALVRLGHALIGLREHWDEYRERRPPESRR